MAERPDPDTGHSEGCTSDMPLSMCQCDTPGWRPVPDPDWATLADRLGFMAQHPVGGYRNWNADLRAAADGLRQYAAITAERDRLRAGIEAHREANTSNCNNLACEKGCGHDLRLYAVLDEA